MIQRGNPARLLRAINPCEAQLLDTAAKVHLRFRLGGENFPPVIYYKIYHHGGICDVNAFAPRDYAILNKEENPGKISMVEYKQNKPKYDNQGWYLRMDNNGWRPVLEQFKFKKISNKFLMKTDYVELYSANKIRYYHFKKEKRDEKISKKTRLNKLRWLQNMYKNARKEEVQTLNRGDDQLDEEELKKEENFLKNPRLIELEDKQFDSEVKELLEWSDNLDYDKYLKEWFQLSTSGGSESYQKKNIPGEFSIKTVIKANPTTITLHSQQQK